MQPIYIAILVIFALTVASFATVLICQHLKSSSGKSSVSNKHTGGGDLTLYYHNQCHWCKKLKPIFRRICTEEGLDCKEVDVQKTPNNKISAFPTIVKSDGTEIRGFMEYAKLKSKMLH